MIRIAAALGLISLVLAGLTGCGDTPPPEAAFGATPLSAYAPERVEFSDLSEGNVTSWAWDFDSDGIIDSTERNPKHNYANPGNYTVTLTVAGSGGNSTEVKTSYLQFEPCPSFANLVSETTTMNGVHPMQFTDLSTGNITSWEWDFESDGRIDSREQHPKHTYRTNGLYSVTLTVTTEECEDTYTIYDYIKVEGCST